MDKAVNYIAECTDETFGDVCQAVFEHGLLEIYTKIAIQKGELNREKIIGTFVGMIPDMRKDIYNK